MISVRDLQWTFFKFETLMNRFVQTFLIVKTKNIRIISKLKNKINLVHYKILYIYTKKSYLYAIMLIIPPIIFGNKFFPFPLSENATS